MRKKLFLLVLPALMALSGCSGVNVSPKANIMAEDTLAHEEIFGEVAELKLKTPRKAAGDPTMFDRAQPAIGVQYQENGEYISIRFVAAIDIGETNINDVTAVWKRTLYWSDNSVGKAEADFESEKAYVTLNNKEAEYSISDFNGVSGTYDYFVVYTMRNIPKETYKDCRLNAYLELNDGEAYSRVLSTTINGSFSFVFEHTSENYFLTGIIDGSQRDVAQHDPTLGNDNQASFITDIDEGDSFIAVCKTNSYFRVYGGSDLGNTTNFVESGGKISPRSGKEGNYAFYLGNDNKLYPSDALVTGNKEYYVKGTAVVGGWDSTTYQLYQENWENLMLVKNVELEEGKEFKIAKADWSGTEYNWNNLLEDSKANFEQGDGTNIKVRSEKGGTYNIYITINQCISIAKV